MQTTKSAVEGILPGQAYRVLCEVSGGVTGYRCAYLKSEGEEAIFPNKAEADTRAAELNKRMNGPYARASFRYTAEAL